MGDPRAHRVTVAVVVRNRRDAMGRCLEAIAAQQRPPDELVVVDNHSTDGTYELLLDHAGRSSIEMRVLRDAGSLGRIRNVALAAADSDVIAFTDSDCAPRPGWLAALLDALEPAISVVQGRTLPAEPVVARLPATQRIEGFTRLYEACNIAYRVDVLREAGGFDEEIGFFGEDTAAGWRVRRLGGRGAYAPEAVVHHDVSYPGPGWHVRRMLMYRNLNALVRRFPEMREELLYARVFLRRRNAVFVAALAGLALHRRNATLAVGLSAPYLWLRRPRRGGVAGLTDSAIGAAYDVGILCGLLTGSVRERTLVL